MFDVLEKGSANQYKTFIRQCEKIHDYENFMPFIRGCKFNVDFKLVYEGCVIVYCTCIFHSLEIWEYKLLKINFHFHMPSFLNKLLCQCLLLSLYMYT